MPEDKPAPRVTGYLRYALVAGFCLVLHNVIVICAHLAGLPFWAVASLAFCIMVCAGYVLVATLAFRETLSWPAFWRYTGAMAANFPISTALLWLFLAVTHVMAIAAPAATFAMVVVNYLGSRWAIVPRRRPEVIA